MDVVTERYTLVRVCEGWSGDSYSAAGDGDGDGDDLGWEIVSPWDG